MLLQLAVGIYGGYFGAGMGIMMLTALSILGMTDILEMNALTSLFGLCINGMAAALFIWANMVYWPFVLVMAIGAIVRRSNGAAGVARAHRQTSDCAASLSAVGFTIAGLFIRVFRGV